MIARLALALPCLAAAPALAEIAPGTLDCRAGRTCITPGQCSEAVPTAPVLALTLAGETAEMRSGDRVIGFRRVGSLGAGQTYLAMPPEGAILLTLEPDLGFAIAAHERLEAGLSALAGLGTCARRNG